MEKVQVELGLWGLEFLNQSRVSLSAGGQVERVLADLTIRDKNDFTFSAKHGIGAGTVWANVQFGCTPTATAAQWTVQLRVNRAIWPNGFGENVTVYLLEVLLTELGDSPVVVIDLFDLI